jgi:preprotein translocase subunit SecE
MSEASPERQQRRAARRAEGAPAVPVRPGQTAAPIEPTAKKRRWYHFFGDSWAELKKVEWPGQSQVIHSTVVVLVACIVVGVFLYANDRVWQVVVQKVFLGQ